MEVSPKNYFGFLQIMYSFKYRIWDPNFFHPHSPSSFKSLESLHNSVIRIALGVHKHTPLSKLKILSGLVSVSKRASGIRIKYISQIHAYGAKHVVYVHTFAGKSVCPNAHPSWNQFQPRSQTGINIRFMHTPLLSPLHGK